MEIVTFRIDEDLKKKVLEFQEYMNRDTRTPMNFSRTLNFLLDLALQNYEHEENLVLEPYKSEVTKA